MTAGDIQDTDPENLASARRRVRPVCMPDLIGQTGMTRWPVCFEPQVPMLVMKGDRGYSLNLANTTAYWGTAYLIGLAGLLLARAGH